MAWSQRFWGSITAHNLRDECWAHKLASQLSSPVSWYGRTLDVGAVAAVENVKNPVKAARLVMDHTPHVLLVGEDADEAGRALVLDVAREFDTDTIPRHRISNAKYFCTEMEMASRVADRAVQILGGGAGVPTVGGDLATTRVRDGVGPPSPPMW